MKLMDDTLMQGQVNGFSFSAVRPETLGATEYTLVTLVLDKTGSTAAFAGELHKIKRAVAQACRKSARADFLMLRVVEFNSQVDEVHGFKPLADIDPAGYTQPACTGVTALNDAVFSAIAATNAYAKTLSDQDYLANALVVVATDGDDNHSATTPADVRRELQKGVSGEVLESLRTILVAVNAGVFAPKLQAFQQAVGIDQYVDIGDATAQRLAKLADFVSRSISAQSQSLGTGGPSQALVF